MRKEVKELFVTEDGVVFTDYNDAVKHEKTIGGMYFKSNEALVLFLKGTDVWKNWEESVYEKGLDIIELYLKVEEVSKLLTEKYPKVFVGNGKRNSDISVVIWESFEESAIIDYFHQQSPHKFSDKKIINLYRKAFSENHSYGFIDTLNEFCHYIEVLNVMLDEEDN